MGNSTKGAMRTIKFRAWDGQEMIYPDDYKKASGKHLTVSEILSRFEIVMQFTGLQDKNDKDVYEGDLLRSFEYGNSVFIVEFRNGAFVKTGDFKRGITSDSLINGLARFEVIGNIHENPELL